MPIRLRQAPGPVRVGAEHADLSGVAAAEALEDLDGRGLAGAVGPEEGEDLTRVMSRSRPSTAARPP
jgi:hypothetical protein